MGTRYTPNRAGLRAIAQSAEVQAAALDGARVIASAARADDPRGEYTERPAIVTGGWDNEVRAGAAVQETRRGDGGERRTLSRVAGQGRR